MGWSSTWLVSGKNLLQPSMNPFQCDEKHLVAPQANQPMTANVNSNFFLTTSTPNHSA